MANSLPDNRGIARAVLPLLGVVFVGVLVTVLPLETIWRSLDPWVESIVDAVTLLAVITPIIVVMEAKRWRAEERARSLAVIVDQARDAVLRQTCDGIILSWNAGAEALTGYRAEEIVGGPPDRVVPPELRERIPQLIARLRHGELIMPYESAVIRKDGTRVPTQVSLTAIRGETGDVSGVAVIIRDLSEVKRLQEDQERLIDQLKHALAKVRTLTGLLPICARCKRIRDDQGYWNEVESFVRDRTEAEFSHGICPQCAQDMYPEFTDDAER